MKIALFTIPLLFLAMTFHAEHARSEDFRGLNCYDGCPQIKAGYEWAQQHDTRDLSTCMGKGADFEKGCARYVYEAGPAPPPPKKVDKRRNDDSRFDDSLDGGSRDPD